MFSIRKGLAVAGITGVAVLGASTSAFASNSPVTIGASVQSSMTVTGFSGTVNFPAGIAGNTVTTAGETYTVSTNDAAGFSVETTLTGDLTGTSDSYDLTSDGGVITVNNTVNGTPENTLALTTAGSPGNYYTTGAAGSGVFNITDSWSLTLPANAHAENYAGSANYAITGN